MVSGNFFDFIVGAESLENTVFMKKQQIAFTQCSAVQMVVALWLVNSFVILPHVLVALSSIAVTCQFFHSQVDKEDKWQMTSGS